MKKGGKYEIARVEEPAIYDEEPIESKLNSLLCFLFFILHIYLNMDLNFNIQSTLLF